MIQYNKGDKFGELTFIEEDFHKEENIGHRTYRKAVIECFCGKRFITRISGVKNGKCKSCGCVRKNKSLKRFTTHNMSGTSEYSSWESMKGRCLNPNRREYKNYGGRGIKICDEWLSFDGFFKDIGKKPSKLHSLERIENDRGYYKENCKWATKHEQERNKRTNIYLTYNGEKLILNDLSKKVGLHQQTIIARVRKGLSVENAVNKPYKYIKSGKYTKI